jgi:hypothetical protein
MKRGVSLEKIRKKIIEHTNKQLKKRIKNYTTFKSTQYIVQENKIYTIHKKILTLLCLHNISETYIIIFRRAFLKI